MTLIEKHARALTMAVLCLRNGYPERARCFLRECERVTRTHWEPRQVADLARTMRDAMWELIAERMP